LDTGQCPVHLFAPVLYPDPSEPRL